MTNTPKIKSWIKAFRLRTLPLALSTILMGSFLAIQTQNYNWSVIILAIVTTLFLQILSNLANDYGDGIKGTDNDNRLGPRRTVQSGEISASQMKKGIIFFVALSLISGSWLIIEGLGQSILTLLFFILGIGAIIASIKYTVGNRSYGYSGYGDIFVFLFFGPVAVLGTSYLASHQIAWPDLMPATSMGLLSTGVLNLNNMRDIENDRSSGKRTIAMRLGLERAKNYHFTLLIFALLFLVFFTVMHYSSPWQFIYLIIYPAILRDMFFIKKTIDNRLLDPFLKKLAFSTLILTLLFGMGLLLA
jgi:1,4-dihydroxy-2-naphthoate octaprenyltransferase